MWFQYLRHTKLTTHTLHMLKNMKSTCREWIMKWLGIGNSPGSQNTLGMRVLCGELLLVSIFYWSCSHLEFCVALASTRPTEVRIQNWTSLDLVKCGYWKCMCCLLAMSVRQRLCINFFVSRAFSNHFAFTLGRYLFLLFFNHFI